MKDNILATTKFVRVTEYTSPSYDFLDLYEEHAVVDFILKKLQIMKGTYPFDPEYGSNLLKYIFEPLDENTINGIKEEIGKVVGEYPVIEDYDMEIEERQIGKEVIINIILNFRSGNAYSISLNSASLTKM